jgi:hypothetical protein
MERMTGFSAIAISQSASGAVRCSPLRAAVFSLLFRCFAACYSRCFLAVLFRKTAIFTKAYGSFFAA